MKRTPVKLAATAGLWCLLISTGAGAANPLGLYIGAGGGAAHLKIDEPEFQVTCGPHSPYVQTTCFNETELGWTVFAGIQPLPFLGAELQYLDFGHGSRGDVMGGQATFQHARALAAFATGTLPLPFIDLYAKAGVARLQTTTSFTYNAFLNDPNACLDLIDMGGTCSISHYHTDSTHARFGGGVGAQLKWSSMALRGEYVRFSVPHGDPDLLSVSLLWKF